nr:MAG TPA: hypothetical protein [Caudoviricetes sp.]
MNARSKKWSEVSDIDGATCRLSSLKLNAL